MFDIEGIWALKQQELIITTRMPSLDISIGSLVTDFINEGIANLIKTILRGPYKMSLMYRVWIEENFNKRKCYIKKFSLQQQSPSPIDRAEKKKVVDKTATCLCHHRKLVKIKNENLQENSFVVSF